MKTSICIILFCMSLLSYGQKDIDAIYEQYKDKPGFTSISINGSFLSGLAALDGDKEAKELSKKLKNIRILVAESKEAKENQFAAKIREELDFDQYEEFMRVNSADENVHMLCKTEKGKISEFLLIVDGKDDQAIIYLNGLFDKSDLKHVNDVVQVDQLKHLRELENK